MDRPVKRGLQTRFIYGVGVRRAAAISQAVERCLVEGGVPASMIRVVPSAVEPELLFPQRSRDDVRAAEGLDAAVPCLLVAAALIRRKGIDVLLDALAHLARDGSTPALWIAGKGPERASLERRVRGRSLENHVRFLGQRDDVPDLLGACDVFVLPSRAEGLGVAALEAMAAARPIVATAVGGLGEAVVHERTGLLVPPENATALADAIARLLRDPGLCARLGAGGSARIAERYGADRMVEAYEDLYLDVLVEPQER